MGDDDAGGGGEEEPPPAAAAEDGDDDYDDEGGGGDAATAANDTPAETPYSQPAEPPADASDAGGGDAGGGGGDAGSRRSGGSRRSSRRSGTPPSSQRGETPSADPLSPASTADISAASPASPASPASDAVPAKPSAAALTKKDTAKGEEVKEKEKLPWWRRLCPAIDPVERKALLAMSAQSQSVASPRSLIPELDDENSFLAKIEAAYQAHVHSVARSSPAPLEMATCSLCSKRIRPAAMKRHVQMCRRRRETRIPPPAAKRYECVTTQAWCRTYNEPSRTAKRTGVVNQGDTAHIMQFAKRDGLLWGEIHGLGSWAVLQQGAEVFFKPSTLQPRRLPPIPGALPNHRLYPGRRDPAEAGFSEDVIAAARAASPKSLQEPKSGSPLRQRLPPGELPTHVTRGYRAAGLSPAAGD